MYCYDMLCYVAFVILLQACIAALLHSTIIRLYEEFKDCITVLYCTVMYCTVLYYTIAHTIVLCCVTHSQEGDRVTVLGRMRGQLAEVVKLVTVGGQRAIK
jgi:hypothetical protein